MKTNQKKSRRGKETLREMCSEENWRKTIHQKNGSTKVQWGNANYSRSGKGRFIWLVWGVAQLVSPPKNRHPRHSKEKVCSRRVQLVFLSFQEELPRDPQTFNNEGRVGQAMSNRKTRLMGFQKEKC